MDLKRYVEELKKIKTLDLATEQGLWQAYKDREDREARRILIESYQPLVFKQAMQFRLMDNIMDIVQEGTIGLIEAVENYDYQRGAAFSLYAVHRIRGRMLNFVKKEGGADIACIDGINGSYERTGADAELVDLAPSLPEQAENSILTQQLQAALARLPQKERLVINSVYLEQKEVKTVAETLEVSTAHIYRLQKTGIRRIRGMMSKFMQHW
ncbi:MAG: sigma-70 family RNA polymerase sigma factor [Selenomonadaceae bacterium]